MNNKNSFTLLHVLLLEDHFKRESFIDFELGTFNNKMNIDIKNHVNGNILEVIVKLAFVSEQSGKNVVESAITMSGSFEFGKEVNIPIESFANINAPAIIFPFIREHLANLTMKSGIQPVFLPPVNFVELAKRKKEKKK